MLIFGNRSLSLGAPADAHVHTDALPGNVTTGEAANSVRGEHAAHSGESQHHHSIFHLRFRQVDRRFFWYVFALMILFTIVVDRIQFYADTACKDEVERMFVNRINAELMMFGTVGLLLFIMEQGSFGIAEDHALLIEFTDILCSLGACNLIVVAFMLRVGTHFYVNEWERLENDSSTPALRQQRGGDVFAWLLSGNHIRPEQNLPHSSLTGRMPAELYNAMADVFRKEHRLQSTFKYHEYLCSSFLRNAVYVMNVQWWTWASLLVLPLLRFALSGIWEFASVSADAYFSFFMAMNWGSCVIFVTITVICRLGQSYVSEYVRQVFLGASPSKPCQPVWGTALKVAVQAASLYNSFLISCCGMLVLHNYAADGYSTGWFILAAFPLALSLILLLPTCLKMLTVVDAFCNPCDDSLDHVTTKMNQVDHDLVNIRTQWLYHAEQDLPETDGDLDEKGLKNLLTAMGLHLSAERNHRIFKALDEDKDGHVSPNEIIKLLKRDVK